MIKEKVSTAWPGAKLDFKVWTYYLDNFDWLNSDKYFCRVELN